MWRRVILVGTGPKRVWRAVVIVLCAALAFQLTVLAAWWVPIFGRGRMEIVAHHGDVAHWPEGTLEAFVAAAKSPADGLEVDVQPSADGTWWAFHDDRLNRLTDHAGSFAALRDAEVEELRVIGGMGSSVAPGNTYRVPRLSEVLAALGDYTGTLILDVRTQVTSHYADLAHLVGNRKVILICRTADGAAAVKAVNPGLQTAAALVVMPRDAIDFRLLDARTMVRSPIDLWFGAPAMIYENGADYGREDPEWFRRAEAWGARWYLTNHIDAAIQESGAAGSGT